LSLGIESLEGAAVDVVLVQSYVETALDLGSGARRVSKEAAELRARGAVEAFGDVVHRRHRSSSQLIAKAEVSFQVARPSDVVSLDGQLAGFTPCFQVLEATHKPHSSNPLSGST
jgi:hypothetical protein